MFGDLAQSLWACEGKSGLTNPISFYDKVIHLVDEGNVVEGKGDEASERLGAQAL